MFSGEYYERKKTKCLYFTGPVYLIQIKQDALDSIDVLNAILFSSRSKQLQPPNFSSVNSGIALE